MLDLIESQTISPRMVTDVATQRIAVPLLLKLEEQSFCQVINDALAVRLEILPLPL